MLTQTDRQTDRQTETDNRCVIFEGIVFSVYLKLSHGSNSYSTRTKTPGVTGEQGSIYLFGFLLVEHCSYPASTIAGFRTLSPLSGLSGIL